ncbi:MAG TPA: hypothetical protein VGC75_00155, partial [Candidatus Nitrosocosmicus sp.]
STINLGNHTLACRIILEHAFKSIQYLKISNYNIIMYILLGVSIFTIIYENNIVNAQSPGLAVPPPLIDSIRSQPSYEIAIPFVTQNVSIFTPHEISIPTGMTVSWFNDDDNPHSISTITNKTYSPPEMINSNLLLPNGGSFTHTFTIPGKYIYYDSQTSSSNIGVINVGLNTYAGTKGNILMMIGGINTIPFNPSKSESVVLSFIPMTINIPPTTGITYNVAILNSDKKLVYSKNFDDADGILDLDLVPSHNNATQFTSWGPDFISQGLQFQSSGTYHIKGPVLVENSPYYITISVVSLNGQPLPNDISDTFVLAPQQSGNTGK